jgi:renalase
VSAARILVVGAGAAGLAAAGRLEAAGHRVTGVGQGRGVGGRLATRRIGAARLDHGAQFFTARGDEFVALTGRWVEAGVAREWCRGFAATPDGHPRFVGADGMSALAKSLAAGLDVRTSVRLGALRLAGGGAWSAALDDGAPLPAGGGPGDGGAPLAAAAVVVTAPVPQALELLAAGSVPLSPAAAGALGAVRYSPTLAALAVLDGPSAVPAPGGVQLDDGPLSWVGDNQAKGISAVPAVTLHAGADESAARYDDPADETLEWMLGVGARWLGGPPADAQLMRWRYAAPVELHDERHLVAVDGPAPLVCAGDAFGEPRVEGAILSGWAAADAVAERLA